MKIRAFIIVTCGSILLNFASARSEVAAGIILGEPTGLSLRIDNFPIIGFSWSMVGGSMYIHADYYVINRPMQHPLRWYLGFGGALVAGRRDFAGIDIRIPLGLLVPFDPRFELFAEIVPGVHFHADPGPALAGGVGLRFIF